MNRNIEAHDAPMSTRRKSSIIATTEKQLLSVDPSLTSTDVFPSVSKDVKYSPETTITEKETSPIAEKDEEKDEAPNNDTPAALVPKYLSGAQLCVVITCVIIVAWLMFLDSSIIVTAIPAISDEFHSLQDIGWYGSAYHVSNAAFQPLTGKIYRYFSSKWSFFVFLVVFEIGSLICGAAPSSLILIAGRVIAGIGSAGIMSGSLTIIAGSVPLEKRPALMGLVIGLANSGSVCGPVLGGVLTDYANWRWTFYINLPIGGVVLLFLAWCQIPDQVPKPKPMAVISKVHTYLDLPGFLLCAGAAVLFLTALELGGNKYAFHSLTVIGLFCGSAVALAAFLVWNYRKGDDGLIPSSMAGKRPVWSAAATTFTLVGSAMIQIYLLPLYFQAVQGATPVQSGINVLPSILSQLAFAYGGGVLVGKFGYYLPWAIAGTAATIIASGLFTSLTPTTSVAQWVGYQIITGGGRGIVLQLPSIAIQANLPPEQISMGMSLVMFSQFMGSAVALAVGNVIFVGALRQDLSKFAPNVDPLTVLAAGATGFRKVVAQKELPGVLMAYVSSVNKEFYLSLGLAIASFCFAWGMGWRDIRPTEKYPPRRMGRPAKKRLHQESAQLTPSTTFRRSSTMSSSTTIQTMTSPSEVVPSNVNDASDFQYGLGVVPSHPEEDGAWTGNFQDPLLELLQSNGTKLMSTEWMDTDTLGFLAHQDESLLAQPHDMPLTPPTTIGSLPNTTEDSWIPSCDHPSEFGHAESFAGDTLPPSPETTIRSSESAAQRLIDLQSLLFSRHLMGAQDVDGLSALINKTVHSTETLIEILESLPQLRPSVEGRRSTSPPSYCAAATDTSGFATDSLLAQHPEETQQHPPNLTLIISLFMTNYLLLLDSYEELLGALRSCLQCSRQSQGPSPGSEFSLVQPFLGSNTPGGNFSKFNVFSSFDLDVNSVVFLLSRMMKRLQKSTESRFAAVSMTPPAVGQSQRQGLPVSATSHNFDFQDGIGQDRDGCSDTSGSYSPMALMGHYALREVSQKHQSVMESLRVVGWLADEL
ncbi:efflux pump [Colletotrichum orchidophilum]|uniref:Efflux pump n=1 Tax=Colletotrichum orchidophilum TaxID=1209926 RepID=A0A1G4BS46_9PEZI|nr:efflux pump [Colletotrichum orchidophilum]OHF04282.1 efflux pump [Colletotrichum orchidophilum]